MIVQFLKIFYRRSAVYPHPEDRVVKFQWSYTFGKMIIFSRLRIAYFQSLGLMKTINRKWNFNFILISSSSLDVFNLKSRRSKVRLVFFIVLTVGLLIACQFWEVCEDSFIQHFCRHRRVIRSTSNKWRA